MEKFRDNKLISTLMQEKYVLFAYVVVFMLNNFTEFFFDYWTKPLYAVIYLWVLMIYLYHTLVSRKYLSDKYYRIAQVFLIINVFCSFIYKANWRFSILQDFAILILYIFVSFGAFHEKQDIGLLEKMMWFLMVVTFATSGMSIYAKFYHTEWLKEIASDRYRGFYNYYNEGAVYCYASIMFSAYMLASRKALPLKVFAAVNIPVQLLYMLFTRARTYILALAASVFILALVTAHMKIRDKKRLRMMYLCMFAVFVIGGYVLIFTKYGMGRNIAEFSFNGYTFKDLGTMPPEVRDEFLNRFTSARWLMWKECFGVIKSSPLIGYGLKSAGFTYFVNRGYNSHNLFINSMMYSGIIGTVWMTYYLFVLMKDSAKNCYSITRAVLWIFTLGNVLIAQLETGLLYNGKNTVALCWAVWGLLTCLRDMRTDAENELY
ncbi:MAG: O-antigen ligase family protein [Solobacterium sp.]|nr:O-antigen ligase family protein [Solobacterium sp.]